MTTVRTDIIDRLDFCLSDSDTDDLSIEYIVVDDGSSSNLASKLRQKCEELELRYIKTNSSSDDPFNLAKARNFAAQQANGTLLIFLDIDLITLPGFYSQVINEAALLDMKHHVSKFLMCPVIYLTYKGYDTFKTIPEKQKGSFCINAMLNDDKDLVDKFSSGTSAIIVSRHYYMAMGGQNESFDGWGYEDYEFTTRLMQNNPQFIEPDNWSSMAGNFMSIDKYSGWKAAYRLHGDWLAAKGIYLIHAPHPVDNSFRKDPDRNLQRLKQQLKRTPSESRQTPLTYADAGVSVIFRKNPFCYSYEFAPFLGEAVFVNENEFIDAKKRAAFIEAKKITRIVFGNPYANDSLRDVYNWARKTGFPYIVAERGALPDSVYHNPSGFLTDSTSYAPEKWDKPLSEKQRQRTEDYISEIRCGSKMLEAQSKRKKLSAVRVEIGLKQGQKMVLVPFQQPNDTVVRHFSGPAKSFNNFHDAISRLPSELGEEWLVVYKKHPVEDTLPPIAGAVSANDINLYDLIELADAMVVINSGSGLYGMMFDVPVYIMGQAFYADKRLNVPVHESKSLAKLIKQGFQADSGLMLAFIHYLRYGFYSFGVQEHRKVITESNNSITATTNIHYYKLRNWTDSAMYFSKDRQPAVPWTSRLYDRYWHHGIPNKQKIDSLKSSHTFIRQAKLKKLRERPIRFIVDAVNNIMT